MKDSIQFVEEYFKDLRDIHQTGGGVKEESFYGSLANLLNGIGKNLKPQVKCIIQLTNRGAGQLDGGLLTKEQWDHGNEKTPLLGEVPARGVIETKPTSDDTWGTAEVEQVSKYRKNVPARVWEYTIGGYQVIKKWLSYREADLLGRPVTPDEAREVMNMARRTTAIILFQPTLDENYEQCKKTVYEWSK